MTATDFRETHCQVLGIDQRALWAKLLARVNQYDFYHLPGYHQLAEHRGEGTARLFVHREDEYFVALPLLLRPIESLPGLEEAGKCIYDATSVYGYAGPLASHAVMPETVLSNFRNTLATALQELGVIAVFSRLHPLIEQHEALAGLGECLPGGETVSIDLRLPLDAQRVQFRGDHKRGINRNRSLGFRVEEDVQWNHLDKFVDIYLATMRRVSAAVYYFFDREYFVELASQLGSTLKLFIVWSGSDAVCAGLFTMCHGIVQYHLGGTADEYLKLAPMKLLFDEVRLWASKQGLRIFHLGGGVGSQPDSLFHFKAGFSDRRHHFFTWRWVLEPKIFANLCAKKEQWNTQRGTQSVSPGYFPPYRATPVAVNCHD